MIELQKNREFLDSFRGQKSKILCRGDSTRLFKKIERLFILLFPSADSLPEIFSNTLLSNSLSLIKCQSLILAQQLSLS